MIPLSYIIRRHPPLPSLLLAHAYIPSLSLASPPPADFRAKEKGEKRSAVRDVKTMEATIHMHKRLHGNVYVSTPFSSPSFQRTTTAII